MKRMIKLLSNVLVLSCLAASYSVAAKTKGETKQAHYNYKISGSTDIEIKGGDVEIIVEAWDKNEVDVTATLEFKGKDNDKSKEFLDGFEEEVKNNIYVSGSSIEINARVDEPNRVQFGSKSFGVTIGYGDDELKLTYKIMVPASNDLAIKNSYEELIVIGNYSGDVKIDHYSGDLEAGSFEDLELELKYGDAKFKEIGDAVMELYEQEIEIDKLETAKIEAKYSTLEIQEAGKLYLDSYESKIGFHLAEQIDGIFKYGNFQITEKLKSSELDTYELTIDIVSVDEIVFTKSRYSEMKIDRAGTMKFFESYEDDINVGNLNKLEMQSKYLDMNVRSLFDYVKLDGYESDLEIYELKEKASLIDIKGKYNELEVDTDGRPFSLDANIHYGDIDYPTSGLERKIMIKESDQLELKLVPSNNRPSSLDIILRGYEIDAEIE